MAKVSKKEQEHSKEMLLKYLQPGDKVFSVIRHVSASGMMRHIDFFTFKENRPIYLSGYIADVLGYSRTDAGALKVRGTGMDMCSSVVSNLCYYLWGTPPAHDPRWNDPDHHKRPGYQLDSERI